MTIFVNSNLFIRNVVRISYDILIARVSVVVFQRYASLKWTISLKWAPTYDAPIFAC